MRSGTWPPPEPSTWYAWTVRPGDRRDRVLELGRSRGAVGVEADRDVALVGEPEGRVDELRVRTVVLVDLEADRAGLEQPPARTVDRAGVRLEPDVDGEALEAREVRLHRRGGSSKPAVMRVVTPPESAAGIRFGLMVWTWLSTAPGVAIRP